VLEHVHCAVALKAVHYPQARFVARRDAQRVGRRIPLQRDVRGLAVASYGFALTQEALAAAKAGLGWPFASVAPGAKTKSRLWSRRRLLDSGDCAGELT
jgi:hypothetical protein